MLGGARRMGVVIAIVVSSCSTQLPNPPATSLPAAESARPTFSALAWTALANLPAARSHLGVTAVGGFVYAIGGLQRGSAAGSAAFDRYDPATDRWTAQPSVPATTDHPAVATSGESIYVFGGTLAAPTTVAWRFDTSRAAWTSIAPLLRARAAAGAATVGGRIYLVGGVDGSRRHITSVDAYDPVTDTWSEVATLPTPREHLAVLAFRSTVCALGGHFGAGDRTDIVECYDPAIRRWTQLPSLIHAASDFGAATVGDSIWAVGDEVQVFDGTSWWTGPALPTPRFGVGVTSERAGLFVVGGSSRRPAPDGLVDRLDVPRR